jgi:hypothetical protein
MIDTNTNPASDGAEGQDDPFAGLESQATALEGAAQIERDEREEKQAASTVATLSTELLAALTMARDMAEPTMTWWPEFHSTWSDAALAKIAGSAAVVMQMHGWDMGTAWVKLGPYIALIGAVGMPSFVTWQAVKERQAQLAYERRQQPARPAVMPAAETVQAAP